MRQGERARSRLDLTRRRRHALEATIERARCALAQAHAQVEPAALAELLARLYAFEREVEAGVASLAGLHAAHDRSTQALLTMERALIELGARRHAAAEPSGAIAPAGASQERLERDIALLTREIAQWQASHARLEQRIGAQAGLLASLQPGAEDDSALAELRLELEHARVSAAASLRRALAPSPAEVEPERTAPPLPTD
jgi:hypothetical protein